MATSMRCQVSGHRPPASPPTRHREPRRADLQEALLIAVAAVDHDRLDVERLDDRCVVLEDVPRAARRDLGQLGLGVRLGDGLGVVTMT